MCGLTGAVDFTGRQVDPSLVERMRRQIHHRGPDDTQQTAVGPLASGFHGSLGFCRLAIIDLSPLGNQPMRSADGRIALVYNGEIYNHHELRTTLEAQGVRFRGRSDTEVLAELLAREWDKALPRLRGMFALAAADTATGRVLLARDRLGKKPLYYRFSNGRLWFASELKSILADPEVPREIDRDALRFYLRYQYIPAPLSIFRGVRKLRPGHFAVCGPDGCDEQRYWRLEFGPKLRIDRTEAVAEVRRRVEEAVRIRLESDVPLGAFLSGGVDSSIVASVMARTMPTKVKTFAIGFDEARFDERQYARAVAERFGTEHHEFVVRLDAMDTLPQLAMAFDEPFADSSALPTYHVSRVTRQHVTVALSGDGGDEGFGGYERYAANQLASRLSPIVRLPGVRAAADALLLSGRMPESRTKARAVRRFWEGARITDDGRRYARWMSGVEPAIVARLLRGDSQLTSRYLEGAYHAPPADLEPFDRMQRLDIETYLPEDLLVKVDRASMANSLEVRAPLLDHELLEFSARLPVGVRNPGFSLKPLLKAAFPELPDVVTGRRKTGFGVPVADWFRSGLGDTYAEAVLGAGSRVSQWMDIAVARELLDQHRARTFDHSTALWSLLMFEHWHRAHLG